MVIGKLTSYLALGLVGAFFLNSLIRPASAIQSGAALGVTGSGIASIGEGIGQSLRSIGSGSAKLFDPLFTLRDLVYSSDVSGSANVGAVANESMQQEFSQPSKAVSSTITWSSGTSAQVPSLSPAAKSYYRALGVSVT
jgi:hypothetical protein